MRKRTSILASLSSAILAAAMPAEAQYGPDLDRQDLQGRVTLTLPLGETGGRDRSKSAPRLSFGVRTESYHTGPESWMLRSEPDVRELNLAVTLDSNRSVLLNDQLLFRPDIRMAKDGDNPETGGLDTYDKTVLTVIGLSLVTIAGSIIIFAN